MKDFNNSPKYTLVEPVRTLADELRDKAEMVRERNRNRERVAFYKKLNSYIRLLKNGAKKAANLGSEEVSEPVETKFASEVVNYFLSQGFKSETGSNGRDGYTTVYVSWA